MRYSTSLFIDLEIFSQNFNLLKDLCPRNEILFMVKADAYGHGMSSIVSYACNELGIKEFGCASLYEAKLLRESLPDLEFEIYVFSDIHLELESDMDIYLNNRIVPVLNNLNEVNVFLKRDEFRHFPVCLQINTGLNRLGIEQSDVTELMEHLKLKKRKNIFHLLTHLGSSSNEINSHHQNSLQKESFQKIKKIFIKNGFVLERTSISNSGAIEQQFGLEETHIRPGLILYGPTSMNKGQRNHSLWKGRSISKLDTYVLKVFEVKKDQLIGYEATPAPDDGVIVLLAIGYGDGFSSRMKDVTLKFKDFTGHILGRVNMDMTQVFFKREIIKFVATGDVFTIWSHNPTDILQFSDQVGSIPYENYCHLTGRVPRIYKVEFK